MNSIDESKNGLLDPILDMAKDSLYCPITHQLFADPVFASDGRIYEKTAIETVLEKPNAKSPITGVILTKVLIPAYTSISLRDELLLKYPHLVDEVYKIIKTHLRYKHEVSQLIKDNRLEELLGYIKFSFKQLSNRERNTIFGCKKNDIIKHVIDNIQNLEEISDSNFRIIHYVCIRSDLEILKYVVDKGVNLEVKTNKNNRPIHYICKYGSIESIKYFINLGVNINVINKSNWKPIDNLLLNSNIIKSKKTNTAEFFFKLIDKLSEIK